MTCQAPMVPCCPNCGASAGGLTPRKTMPLPFRCPNCGHQFAKAATRRQLDLLCVDCKATELQRFPEGARLAARLARRRAVERRVSTEVRREIAAERLSRR